MPARRPPHAPAVAAPADPDSPDTRSARGRFTDTAGVAGAIFAALCCAGGPLIAGVISSIGLSFIRRDSILMPLLAASLLVALWGFMAGRRQHGSDGPLLTGIAGGAALVGGIFVARWLLVVGTVLMIAATVWNIAARRRGPLVQLASRRAT